MSDNGIVTRLQDEILWRERHIEDGFDEMDAECELLELTQRRAFIEGLKYAIKLAGECGTGA